MNRDAKTRGGRRRNRRLSRRLEGQTKGGLQATGRARRSGRIRGAEWPLSWLWIFIIVHLSARCELLCPPESIPAYG